MNLLAAVPVAVSGTLIVIGAILAILGFISYLVIVFGTKKQTPEEFLYRFSKKKFKNASATVDMWGAITLGIAIIGLLLLLVAVFLSK